MSQKQRKGTRIQSKQNSDGVQTDFEQVEEYSPYPPMDFLQAVHTIDPLLIERIMVMAEKEQQQRFKTIDEEIAEIQKNNSAHIAYDTQILELMSRGQWLGLILSLSLVILGGIAVVSEQTAVAVTAITAIVGILVVYVLRKPPSNDDSI